MNEEEKQAIEFLKHSLYEYEEIDTSVLEDIDKNHKIIYKLILKQHKEIEKRLKEIDSLYKMMSAKDDEIEKLKEDYQILKDDIEGHRIAYIDTPEFEENYISKDKIKELIEKYKTEKNNITQIVFSKYGKTQQAYKQVVYTNLIRVLEGLLSGQESDQEGGQEDE